MKQIGKTNYQALLPANMTPSAKATLTPATEPGRIILTEDEPNRKENI